MTKREIDKLMEQVWGENWKDIVIVGPLGSFALRDVYNECGMSPGVLDDHKGYGLFQHG